jgi:ABC-type nitrate/sulfonate/bicarbonate transport system substrate-binding protein
MSTTTRTGQRRLTALALAASAAVALLVGCTQPAPAPTDDGGPVETATVRIGEQAPCVCQLAFYVAADAGFFEDQSLDVSFVTEPTPLTGILTESAEMSMASPGQAALAVQKGADARVIVTAQSRLTQSVFVGPNIELSDPDDWEAVANDLKGHRLGITTRGGSTDTNLRYILKSAGIDPDTEVEIIPLGAGPSMVAGVQSQQVDAALSFQPLTASMLAQDLGVVTIDLAAGDGPENLDQPMTTGIVRGEWAEANPDVVARIVAAVTAAEEFMADDANRDAVLDVARTRLAGTDDATLNELLDQLIPLLRPTYTEEDNDRVNAVLVESGLIPAPVDYADITTPETPQ